jgi:DNA-binding winged helix-turn-helix (wHTH) protein
MDMEQGDMRYRFGAFEMNTRQRRLIRRGEGEAERVEITPLVHDLIRFLIEERDRVVSKQELWEEVWNARFVGDSAVQSAISDARRALRDPTSPHPAIETHYRRGYRFVSPVEELASNPA